MRYVVRAAFDAGAAAGAIIFISRGDGRTGAERQRAREKYSKKFVAHDDFLISELRFQFPLKHSV